MSVHFIFLLQWDRIGCGYCPFRTQRRVGDTLSGFSVCLSCDCATPSAQPTASETLGTFVGPCSVGAVSYVCGGCCGQSSGGNNSTTTCPWKPFLQTSTRVLEWLDCTIRCAPKILWGCFLSCARPSESRVVLRKAINRGYIPYEGGRFLGQVGPSRTQSRGKILIFLSFSTDVGSTAAPRVVVIHT